MSGAHSIGIPGVEIDSGDHLCAVFEGEERRDEILFSFLRAGLDAGVLVTTVPSRDRPSVLVVCPRCNSAWDHDTDGVLTKRRS